MKSIFDRFLQVVHWCAFLSTLLVVLAFGAEVITENKISVGDLVFYTPNSGDGFLLAFAPAFVAPIVLYILKGRWIIFPWRH